MIVTVREHDAFDTAGTRRQCLADRCRRDGLQRAIAVGKRNLRIAKTRKAPFQRWKLPTVRVADESGILRWDVAHAAGGPISVR